MIERVKLIVAMHKPYALPNDPMYVPLHVGAKGKPDFYRLETIVKRGGIPTGEIIPGDDTGDNISEKNPSFC